MKKTAYEIWNGKKPKVKYFRVFGSKCYILNDRENLGKSDAKSDEGIFLGYSTSSRAYRVYNKRTKTVMESINMKIDDAITKVETVDDGEGPSTKEPIVEVEALDIEVEGYTPEKELTPVNSRVETRSMSRKQILSLLRNFILLSLGMMKCPLQKNHHHKWLKTIRKVTLLDP